MSRTSLLLIALLSSCTAYGQKDKLPRYLGEPVWTDSASTIFFPVQYSEKMLSENKVALGGDYFANLIVYDFKQDVSRKLFEGDTYIQLFQPGYGYRHNGPDRIGKAKGWIFFLVKNNDYNGNGRIDERDPSILYVVTTKGEEVRPLTKTNENVVSFQAYEKQGFALVKIQRDLDKNRSFQWEDNDYYYRKIDLEGLKLGNAIEMR